MAKTPPPRAPERPYPYPFRTFELPDGRIVFIRPEAVNVIYDQEGAPGTAVVATSTVNMLVPYTATRVMEILRG